MSEISFIKKDTRELFDHHDEDAPYLSFKCLDSLGFVKNAVTLRNDKSGSPVRIFWHPGEDLQEITKYNEKVARQLGTDLLHRISALQKHTANVHIVNENDLGSSLEVSHISFTDGLVTNIRGTALVVSVADCIPLCFADPVNKAIGIAHSGRVGTLKRIGAEVIRKMSEAFGSHPENIIATIGPGICSDCYEVGDEIYDEFSSEWGKDYADRLLYKTDSKHHLDLWAANKMVLEQAGLKPDNIITGNICNRCNMDKFYSFRGDGRIINQISVWLMLL